MLKEYKTMIILTLCCLTMVSIGFSSWVVTNPNTTEDVNGSLEADSIIDNRKYISEIEQTVLSYTDLGFLKNGYYSNTGEMSITYNINTKACASYFNSLGEQCDALNLEICAKYADGFASEYNIFQRGGFNLEYSINDGEYQSDWVDGKITSNCEAISIMQITDLTSESLKIKFLYSFEINMGKTFKTNAYDKLLSLEGFKFEFSLFLSLFAFF